MCTITLSYNANNTLASKLIDVIRESGVFEISQDHNEEWSKEDEREAFLHTSRVNASKMFANCL